jgi:hypothetical protein
MEMFNLEMLNVMHATMDINRAWEVIRDNIVLSANEKLGYWELKHCKPWVDRERYYMKGSRLSCSDYRIQAKLMHSV